MSKPKHIPASTWSRDEWYPAGYAGERVRRGTARIEPCEGQREDGYALRVVGESRYGCQYIVRAVKTQEEAEALCREINDPAAASR